MPFLSIAACVSQSLPVPLWPSAINYMTHCQDAKKANNISCDWRDTLYLLFVTDVLLFYCPLFLEHLLEILFCVCVCRGSVPEEVFVCSYFQ